MKKKYNSPNIFDSSIMEMAVPAALASASSVALAAKSVAGVAGYVAGVKATKAAMNNFNFNIQKSLLVKDI